LDRNSLPAKPAKGWQNPARKLANC